MFHIAIFCGNIPRIEHSFSCKHNYTMYTYIIVHCHSYPDTLSEKGNANLMKDLTCLNKYEQPELEKQYYIYIIHFRMSSIPYLNIFVQCFVTEK